MPRQSARSAEPRPIVKLSSRGSSRLKNGHVWVYRSDIVSSDEVPAGAVVDVADERGKFLGTALYSSASQIAVRMVSSGKVEDLPSLLRNRIQAAIAYRELMVRDRRAGRAVHESGLEVHQRCERGDEDRERHQDGDDGEGESHHVQGNGDYRI